MNPSWRAGERCASSAGLEAAQGGALQRHCAERYVEAPIRSLPALRRGPCRHRELRDMLARPLRGARLEGEARPARSVSFQRHTCIPLSASGCRLAAPSPTARSCMAAVAALSRGTAGTRQKERPHGAERPVPSERTRRSRHPQHPVRRCLARPVHGGVGDDPRVRPGAGSDRSQPRPPLRDRIVGLGGAALAFELLGRH